MTEPAGAGDLDGSVFLLEAALLRQNGSADRDSLRARTAVAIAYWDAGRKDAAVELLDSTAETATLTLGPDDPDAVVARGNLAAVRAGLGQWARAVPELSANVADRERLLGADHPATLNAQDALATALRETGALRDALQLSIHVSARRQRVLGSSHPDTLATRTGHALTLADLGNHHEATAVLVAALQDAERDHTDGLPVAVSRGHLARCLASQGDFASAAAAAGLAAKTCSTHLGPGHADTVALRADAADFAQRIPHQRNGNHERP